MNELILIIIFLTMILAGGLLLIFFLAVNQNKNNKDEISNLSEKLESTLNSISKNMENNYFKQSQLSNKQFTDIFTKLAIIDNANSKIHELTGQVSQLSNVLANKTARGAFGEIQLENLVKTVLPPNTYEFQKKLSNDKIADCILKLPNPPGNIVIDAKFPLEAWNDLQEANTKELRDSSRKRFAEHVKKHVRDIYEKYLIPGETSDSACLFLPSEAVYSEIHSNLPDIIKFSFKSKVWIVSPTTMMATLNTIRAILRDAKLQEQTKLIQKEMGSLIDDIGRLSKRAENLERHFGLAKNDLEEIQISTKKISSRGKKIEDLEFEENIKSSSFRIDK